ncbi:MAG: glycosyl hydrolase [Planctomycetota bacterium]
MKSITSLRVLAVIALIAALCVPVIAGTQSDGDSDEQMHSRHVDPSNFVSSLKFRNIGPAFMSGRIADIAVDQQNPNTWYVGAGSGSIWKTTNAGTTWTPVFDNYPVYSIGCITIDPQNSNTVWVGTGENNGGRHISFGDGVYVSHDGGKSFQNKGLSGSEHISKIMVHPGDSNTIYVASQGPLWSPGGERGLYKSTDGGETWSLVLSSDNEYTGVTDIVIDPENPDVMYAATHQRHRNVWALVNSGKASGIHKSTDGGETWTKLGNGLPGGEVGKISLGVCPFDCNVVYATIELPGRVGFGGGNGGFWQSTDAGASWNKISDTVSGGTGPHYYQELFVDPHRQGVLYQADVRLRRSVDGGVNWESVEGGSKHVDNHAVAFHPTDEDFVVVGCDGGVYVSYDFTETYRFVSNLPLTQFYKLSLDNEIPFYHVTGGTQDNNSQYGPVRTRNVQGIRNSDWRITIGGDGHDNAIDPEDPDTIYSESQQGYIRRFDRRTGEAVDIRPQPGAGEESLRFNWDAPILISPHSHTRVYFGSKKLHRTDDRGDSWVEVSPDLSRGIDRYTLPTMGSVPSVDAGYDLLAMSRFGNITSISESPLVEGLLYVGTDDGLIQISEDGGETWRKVDRIFDIPDWFFVNDIKADLHDPDTVYACMDDHKTGDYSPYVVVSRDRGRTWESMVGNLPEKHICWRIVQDHVRKDLFFLATEFGIYCTLDAGENWFELKSGLPTISFRDLEIQKDMDDLVGASFGRGFYVLDDYSLLRDVTPELFENGEFHMFPIRTAFWYLQDDELGGRTAFQGDSHFSADNPTYGATFTYYVGDEFKSLRQQRKERERKLIEAGEDVPTPTFDELREEELEIEPAVYLEIYDSAGEVVRRINGSSSKGIHRATWDFRMVGWGGSGRGPMAGPGDYTVCVFRYASGETTALCEPQPFEVQSVVDPSVEMADRDAVIEFSRTAGRLSNEVNACSSVLAERLEQISGIKDTLRSAPQATAGLLAEAESFERRLKEMQLLIDGDDLRSSRFSEAVPSISGRLGGALFGSLRGTQGPTETHRQQFAIAETEFAAIRDELKTLLEDELEQFEQRLDEAGIAWSSGRSLPGN